MTSKRLVVISFDCLSALDFPFLQELPNFREYLKGSAYCKNVETIYPSVTYPCHATIVTGKFPKNHGVINNTLIQPGKESPDWYWHRRNIKGTTLYDEAKKAGKKTAALLWPVTAKADIDYNMPEIFANRPWHNQIAVSLLNGSPAFQLDMNRRFGHIRKGLNQPELDDFVLESTVQTIKDKKPELLLVHFTDLDTQRHYHGFDSNEAKDAIKRHDIRLGRIISALKESQLYDDTILVLLGDHSALDESKVIKPNVFLKGTQMIKIDKNNHIEAWEVYCKSCDGSAYIYVKDHRTDVITSLKSKLDLLVQDENNGIDKVYTGAEASKLGADPACHFMLEARKGYYFSESHHGNFIEEIKKEDVMARKYTLACHGYSPKKEGYATVFMAKGKGIRPDTAIPSMHLVDEGPTLAHILGLDLGKTDGRIIEELFSGPINPERMGGKIQ
ncbi:alkaline phosphatase family protein [Falsibacillus albus]